MTEKQLENYIRGKYIGIVKGNYDAYCSLRADEINNFVQNAGRYADLEIIKLRGYEVLFDTKGQFINRIWPELCEGDRDSYEMRNTINQIAMKLDELRENDTLGEQPIEKVRKFMDEVFSQEVIQINDQITESAMENEQSISFEEYIF